MDERDPKCQDAASLEVNGMGNRWGNLQKNKARLVDFNTEHVLALWPIRRCLRISCGGYMKDTLEQISFTVDVKIVPFVLSGKMIHSTVKTKQKLIRSSTQRKIDKLRKIIPGCEEVDVETLFQKTMEEILELKMQVDILKRLSKLHGV
ncbi:hypothetical protein CK203_040911 [Vitis vinifera]|uniref:Uncharacterized protein n=1 Tax=Vitis vinifera TaxID=29760 RepID=A0A438HVB6_VITVI|nr:hypothetical protein CK203_040911 [Vitis vinifera]